MTEDNNENKFKRVTPRVNTYDFYTDIYHTYNIPLSHILERNALNLVNDDKERNNEIWLEVNLIAYKIKILEEVSKEVRRSSEKIQQKISADIQQLQKEKDIIEGDITKSYGEKIAENIQKASNDIRERISLLARKRINEERYKRISFKEVENICNKYSLTPKMVLPFIEYDHIENYFDKKCQRFKR